MFAGIAGFAPTNTKPMASALLGLLSTYGLVETWSEFARTVEHMESRDVPECRLLRLEDLKETAHFLRWRQEEVAKIVHCGEPPSLSKIEEEATCEGGLKFFAT